MERRMYIAYIATVLVAVGLAYWMGRRGRRQYEIVEK